MKSVKNIFIFIGPPGSGKGSLSHLCKKAFGWAHLSTGNLCRQHIVHKTAIGVTIDTLLKSGKLIDDAVMMHMVSQWINDVALTSSGIILDGFPRTVSQAQALDKLFSQKSSFDIALTIVSLRIKDEQVVNRLKTRFVCQNDACQAVYSFSPEGADSAAVCKECEHQLTQRVDDKGDVVHERLKTYHQYAEDLLTYYKNSSHKIIDLDVELPLSDVFQSFIDSAGEKV